LVGDRGYDVAAIRHGLRARHILPLLAMRRTKHGSTPIVNESWPLRVRGSDSSDATSIRAGGHAPDTRDYS
jgi:hypothetical protein